MNDSAMTMQPITAQTAPREPIPDTVPPTVDERITVLSDALEAALDPDATTKSKADALAKVRDVRTSRATDGKR